MILRSLQISGAGPIGFSRRYATQHDIPSKVRYVQGGWLSSGFDLFKKVTSTRFELKDDFSSLDVCIRPVSLEEHVRTSMIPLTFQSFHIGGYKWEEADQLLAALCDIAADPRRSRDLPLGT